MILKVIKTYEKAKNCLCVAIVENEYAAIESAPAFLTIKKQVTKGQLIELPCDAVIITREATDAEGNALTTEHGEIISFSYWKLKA